MDYSYGSNLKSEQNIQTRMFMQVLFIMEQNQTNLETT